MSSQQVALTDGIDERFRKKKYKGQCPQLRRIPSYPTLYRTHHCSVEGIRKRNRTQTKIKSEIKTTAARTIKTVSSASLSAYNPQPVESSICYEVLGFFRQKSKNEKQNKTKNAPDFRTFARNRARFRSPRNTPRTASAQHSTSRGGTPMIPDISLHSIMHRDVRDSPPGHSMCRKLTSKRGTEPQPQPSIGFRLRVRVKDHRFSSIAQEHSVRLNRTLTQGFI